jgi:H+/Cl- antiporter ClcA
MGNYTYFGQTSAELHSGAGWLAVIVCGVLGGITGGLFSAALVRASRGLPGWAGRFVVGRPVLFAACCGLAIALIGLASGGSTYGTGYAQARELIAGHDTVPVVFFLLKGLATLVSYISGIPGGLFSPSLAVGAGLGGMLSHLFPGAAPGAVVLLGMEAYFAGAIQSPITAIVIVTEMTDNQRMTVPLMTTAVLAYAVSRLLNRRPLYSALADRFLDAQERRAQH